MRFLTTLLSLALFATAAFWATAGDDGRAGNWKMTLFEDGPQTLWILSLDAKGGKPVGRIHTLKGVQPTVLDNLKLDGDFLYFTLRLRNGVSFDYEGKLPRPGAKKAFGSLTREGSVIPVVLEATTAKDDFALNREILTRTPNDPRAFAAVFDVLAHAAEHKVPAKDVQEMVDASLKAAEAYGPRWQLNHSLKLVEALQKDPTYAPVAVEAARKAEKLLDPKAPVDTHLRLLSVLAEALRQAKRGDEAQGLEGRIAKLEGQAYAEHAKAGLGFPVEKVAGKGKRPVLVELFTGAHCPPCVATDLAFDAVGQAYPPTAVVLLQYHLHVPRPDPMTAPENEARFEFYAETYSRAVRGAPAILFNGKPDAPGGGTKEDAEDKFKEYRGVIAKLREKPAGAAVTATAVRNGDTVEIKAAVKDLAKPGDKMRLRLALVEDWVRYRGSNGMTYHHRVVRAMPGGAKGFALEKKDSEHTAKVDLNELRKTLNRSLDEAYPEGPRPMRLTHLHVVAFVQDDETTEVLQAVEVPVKGN